MSPFSITKAITEQDLAETIRLFEAYALSLGIDLTFQDFATEMTQMPGKYAPPTGTLLIARDHGGEAIGCVGLRQLDDGICEMKRLYVDPKGRGTGVGRALAQEVIKEGKKLGYSAMRLDTLPNMTSARGLYRGLGFVEIPSYYDIPIEGTIFLELRFQP